jgi:hypothetical protein
MLEHARAKLLHAENEEAAACNGYLPAPVQSNGELGHPGGPDPFRP